MKNLMILSFLSALMFFSCRTTDSYYNQPINEVTYFKSTIHSIDRDIITTANGIKWKTDRLVIAVNMSNIFVVLNQLGIGDAYIDGTRYSIRLLQSGFVEGFRYNRGFSNTLKTTHAENNIVELSDGTWWQIIQKGDVEIEKWLTTNIVILSEDETTMINPHRIEAIRVNKLENKTNS